MEKLLQWSIAQQTGDKEVIDKIGQPDPKMLADLFGGGGADEPTLMKQSMFIIDSQEATLENKEIAFDNFEMLIENLDNANNIENLKLWPSITNQLNDDNESVLKIFAASVIGTAVQNNPKSQEDFQKYVDTGLSKLISNSITRENEEASKTDKDLRYKSLFAIASFIRNYQAGYDSFNELNGWSTLKNTLVSIDDTKSNLRVLSLISSILSTGLDDTKIKNLKKFDIVKNVINLLNSSPSDQNLGCIDKILNIISQLYQLKYTFEKSEVNDLAKGLENIESVKDQLSIDDYNSAKHVIV